MEICYAMRMWARFFGRKPFTSVMAEADRLFQRKEYGQAKLTYGRALGCADTPAERAPEILSRINACGDAIARSRLAEAIRLFEEGSVDLAEEELLHALDTAVCQELQQTIRARLEGCRTPAARRSAESLAELDDDSRFLALGGHWEDDQQVEYDGYGERFRAAFLRLHEGRVEVAARDLEALLADVPDAQYLWFEVGRARLGNGDRQGAIEALGTFLRRLDPQKGGDARLSAYMTLAAIAGERDDIEGALEYYGDAVRNMPEDPRPYLAMGAFMRRNELTEESVDVLESGLAVLGDEQPHYLLWQELGLAYSDVGRTEEAIRWLEKTIAFFTSRKQFDVPAESALMLARLYEQEGNLGRAADLLKLLAEGSDRDNLFSYHVEAGRVLASLGATEEAQQMAIRATDLLPEGNPAGAAALEQLRGLLEQGTG